MLRGILIGVLVVGVAGTAYWGYQEHIEKNAVLIHAENNYQRAFHDLSYQVDLLNDKIGSTLAMNSRQQLSPSLAEVWRITSAAHSDVGQLPLTLLPFNKTEEFLANVGDFSYRTAIRDLDKEPLTDDEYKTLQSLYEKSADIQKELRKVQHLVLENNLRWMDVQLALSTDDQQDNSIIDGFKTVEKNVEAYSEADFGPSFTSMNKEEKGFKYLTGNDISKQQAIKVAQDFLGLQGSEEVKVTENGKGSDYGFYSLSIQDPKSEATINMDVTKKGGYPIWVLRSRDVKERNISLNEAMENAKKYLNEHKFKNLELNESAQFDNIGVFTFSSVKDNVLIYPDTVTMKVALDDGNVVGFSAKNYLMAHHDRKIPKPAISVEEARKKINPGVEVMENRLAIIINDLEKEVLCYEFLGTIDNDTYRIFINAETGQEEKVEKFKNPETVYNKTDV
ncbi:germination protein YpeB [Bacillus suaedaesalsae]|uniref:Germination protein YpeB n=1 Tax=Bacillus suaedaesalsae TaxID=2810349 RepID=A0ABS2DQ41_9BACI|nr:germination protein YpeB [Bacillus suaedaesalsae]MBM6619888.1 germination protein YpeB [Bacillus suaedaesalsae]